MPINYKLYHPKWKAISRFIRFYRAKNHYEFCGAENYKPNPITGSKVVLTVAHLDHDITNNSFFNLKALCQRCHLKYDAKQHARSRRINKLKNQLSFNF